MHFGNKQNITFWDHWAHCGVFENGVLLIYTLKGVSSVANFISAYDESQLNPESNFLIRSVFFVSKSNLFDVYLFPWWLVYGEHSNGCYDTDHASLTWFKQYVSLIIKTEYHERISYNKVNLLLFS